MKVTILGSGGSSGTPAVDWGWGRCDPNEPRNRRTRQSIVVEHAGARILVDTSPDLRAQMLATGFRVFDAVIYTHAHADHLHGIDDLRAVNRLLHAPIDVYSDEPTLQAIRERFDYAFRPQDPDARTFYRPTLNPRAIRVGETFTIGAVPVTVFAQDHGFSKSLGLRFGDVAYSTDVVDLPEESFAALEGVRVWLIGTLTDRPHPCHCHVAKAIDWATRVGCERTVLTHLGLDLDYATLRERLPFGFEPAYDGMTVELAAHEIRIGEAHPTY